MRFYDSPSIERIGFDFYCDIANNIVKLREENGFTQKDLAVKTGIKEYRISNMENVKIRIDLDAVEELAKALNVSADYLIDAELDCGGKECLYQVWLESEDRFKLYIRASSKRMAFLKFDKKFKECGVRYNSSRERIFIKLVAPDISEKPYVIYGKEAEQYIRELFRLDYPQYQVMQHEYRILQSLDYPFMQASLDGELVDQDGRKGILEIKTTNILQSMQYEKWKDRIPDNYYIQVLHYLLVTGYEFVVLRAHLRSNWGTDVRTQVKHYFIERTEVQADLDYLQEEEIKFWKYVESGRKPPLILPEI